MGKGWDRFKTILLNIFTEEVEVEIKEPKKRRKKVADSKVANMPSRQNARVHVKKPVTRQVDVAMHTDVKEDLVERKENSFRFPVIPDSVETVRKDRKKRVSQEKLLANRAENVPSFDEKQRIQLDSLEKPRKGSQAIIRKSHHTDAADNVRRDHSKTTAEIQLERRLAEQERRRLARRKDRRPATTNQSMSTSYESQYAAYEQEKALKQMDQVPAFVRRASEKEQEMTEDVHPVPTNNTRGFTEETGPVDGTNMTEEKVLDETLIYSTPDELDWIFKKKDQLNEEQVSKQVVSGEKVNNADPDTKLDCGLFAEESHEETDIHLGEIVSHSKEESEPLPKLKQPGNPLEELVIKPRQAVSEVLVEEVKEQTISSPVERDRQFVHDIPHHLLDDPMGNDANDAAWLEEQQFLLERTLTHFKIRAKVVHVTQGPTVTRFEIQPELGVKVSTIRNLADDLKLNLAAKEIRIEAPIPGKNTVGIEIPNAFPQMVTLQQIIETPDFAEAVSPLSIALGVTIEGDPLITNISKMPHGLIAGATGSGKSVCINTILLSLLYKASYEDVKFLLIDPKMVELAPYNGIPHLVAPVITDVKAATAALKWAVQEMENRYERFVDAGVRNMEKYNEKVASGQVKGEKMPYIVIVIDELADLMMVSPQDVEDAICRIAQKARACGMHLLLATQRPSVDVITGLIKANIPTRIAFTVSSQVDSRTIMDTNGAEKLLGKGDMLFMENGSGRSLRLQGPFVSDEEIERVTAYMRKLAEPNYLFEQEQLLIRMEEDEQDELFEEVLLFVLDHNQASTSLLQRQFRIGYNRAARLIDTLYAQGVISAANGAKPREVLITYEQADEMFFTK